MHAPLHLLALGHFVPPQPYAAAFERFTEVLASWEPMPFSTFDKFYTLEKPDPILNDDATRHFVPPQPYAAAFKLFTEVLASWEPMPFSTLDKFYNLDKPDPILNDDATMSCLKFIEDDNDVCADLVERGCLSTCLVNATCFPKASSQVRTLHLKRNLEIISEPMLALISKPMLELVHKPRLERDERARAAVLDKSSWTLMPAPKRAEISWRVPL